MNRLITKITAGLLVVSFSCLCVPESLRTALADEIQAQSLNSSVEDDREITRDELAYVTPEKMNLTYSMKIAICAPVSARFSA